MKKLRHRALMSTLMKESGGNYAKVAKWLQVSETYGDGTYNRPQPTCECCGQKIPHKTRDEKLAEQAKTDR